MKFASSVNRFIFWLQARPLINMLLVLGYFFMVLFMHDPLVIVSKAIEDSLSLPTYNLVVEIFFVVLLLFLVLALFKQVKIDSVNRKLELTYLFLTVAFIIIHSRFMFDSSIEVIHSFEFTFLAFLIFPFTKRFGAAIIFTLPFMLIDEWYQLTTLYPWLDYLDMNDVLMDTYGCGLAMAVLMFFGIKGQSKVQSLHKRSEFIALVLLAIIILLAVKLCFIAFYGDESCNNTLLVINENNGPEPFYRFHPTHNIWYHVMKPAEGLIAIGLLHFFYLGLDSFRKHTGEITQRV